MLIASATDLAIVTAIRAGTLKLVNKTSRFGDAFVSIEDERGMIEVANSQHEAKKRVKALSK